jgi:hypothetical protein
MGSALGAVVVARRRVAVVALGAARQRRASGSGSKVEQRGEVAGRSPFGTLL